MSKSAQSILVERDRVQTEQIVLERVCALGGICGLRVGSNGISQRQDDVASHRHQHEEQWATRKMYVTNTVGDKVMARQQAQEEGSLRKGTKGAMRFKSRFPSSCNNEDKVRQGVKRHREQTSCLHPGRTMIVSALN